jgi:Sulfotransferase domain
MTPRPLAFGIGLPKTGTTSLGDAVTLLGWSHLAAHGDRLMRRWRDGDLAALRTVAKSYDLLTGLPWPLMYEELAETFPCAKFILTRRSSTERWVRSQVFHTAQYPEFWLFKEVYGASPAASFPDVHRAFYERHNAKVRAFFAGSARLLEVCWEEGDGWTEICPFLEVSEPHSRPFPHSNPTPFDRAS